MADAVSPTVYQVLSRGSVRIPAEDLLVDGELSINPALDQKGYFTVHFRGRDLELAATGYCGFIPINSRVAIEVRPKMPVESLGRVFDVAGLSLPKIAGLKRRYDTATDASAPVLEFLAGEYASALALVIDHGLKKSYQFVSANNSNPRGRLNFQETIRRNFARGRPDWIVSQHSEQQIDIRENRLLKGAGELLLARLRSSRAARNTARRDLASFLPYFSGASRFVPADLHWLRERAATLNTDKGDLRVDAINQALALAMVILDETEVEVGALGGAVDLSAVVVDFDKLFEEYVRNSLKIERQRLALDLVILDGNKGGKKGLFDGKSTPPAQPDIVVRGAAGNTLLLAEVKYKSWPDRGDYNQAIIPKALGCDSLWIPAWHGW